MQMGRMGARAAAAETERGRFRQTTATPRGADEKGTSQLIITSHRIPRSQREEQGKDKRGGKETGSGVWCRYGESTLRGRGLTPQEAEYLRRPEVKIVIPDALKLQLVDDWENVTKNSQVRRPDFRDFDLDPQLVALPRKPNVRDLLEEYRAYVLATKKSQDRSA